MQIPKFPTRIKACFHFALQLTAWCFGRMTLQTKSIQILAQWHCATDIAYGLHSSFMARVRFSQRLLRSRIYVSWQCNSSFQVAARALRKRQDKPGDELASAGNWRFRTIPKICFIWFADEGNRKISAAMILILTPSVARWG